MSPTPNPKQSPKKTAAPKPDGGGQTLIESKASPSGVIVAKFKLAGAVQAGSIALPANQEE